MGIRSIAALLVVMACSSKPAATPPRGAGRDAPASGLPGTAGADGAITGGAAAPGAPGGAAPIKVTLADVGLEASSLDRSVDPCVDFYQFACGGWLQNHPIPPDRPGWGRFSEVDDKNQRTLRALLEAAARDTGADAQVRQLGDYYASCMDEAAIEAAGAAGLRPLLDKVAKVADARSWLAALSELHRHGRWVVWRAVVEADLKASSTYALQLDAAGLGLPDREYYETPELAPKLDEYRAHVARTLALAGTPAGRAQAAAADVIAIERALARLTRPAAERRDVAAGYNPIDGAGLAAQVRTVDWKAYWKGLGIPPPARLLLGTPRFFAQLDGLRARFGAPAWASYFTYHAVHAAALALPRAFADEAFALERLVRGTERPRERSARCVRAVRDALGELLGARYAAQQVAPGARQAAARLVDAMVEVMHDELGELTWMSDATRGRAQAKLARLARLVGHPDRWRAYDFDVKRDDFHGNLLRAAAFATHRELARAGRPVERDEWPLQVYDADAWYEPRANAMALPAGLLQAPFFGQDRALAANLGGLGMFIGHELTHAFDDQGARFDAEGDLANWWAPEDQRRFDERAACLASEYGGFEAAPGGFVNGRLTLGENIADLGGAKLAFAAHRALRRDAAKVYVADGFTEDQQFFVALGQAWCNRDRPAEIQRRLVSDRHAPTKLRVFGALRNLPAFAEAWRCGPGTPMNPAKICAVW